MVINLSYGRNVYVVVIQCPYSLICIELEVFKFFFFQLEEFAFLRVLSVLAYLGTLCPYYLAVVFSTEKYLSFSIFRGFKALKQTVKLYYKLGKYIEMMDAYRVMLTYIKSAVTRNYSEKCINNIMDFVSGSASQNFGLLQEFYQTTLRALEEAKNEVRFLISCLLKKCK